MESMKKEISRLNSIIASGCMGEENKKATFTRGKCWRKVRNQALDMLKVADQ
jgi:hypothetical protein